jgi:phosphotransferase system HPr (HPr) family protein
MDEGEAGDLEATREVTISNSLGLHARAAARMVETAEKFKSEIRMEKDGEGADVRSVLSLLTLECPAGSRVRLKARGVDSRRAIEALVKLIEDKFDEE